MIAPTMPIQTLLEWVSRGLVVSVGNTTISQSPEGLLWHEYFVDYPEGRFIDEKRICSEEESLASLARANEDDRAHCLERAHRCTFLEACIAGESKEARAHAERVAALRAQLEATRAQRYRAVLPNLHRQEADLVPRTQRLRARLGITTVAATAWSDTQELEEEALRLVLAGTDSH